MKEIFVEINNGLSVRLIEVMKARESRVKPTKVLKTRKVVEILSQEHVNEEKHFKNK